MTNNMRRGFTMIELVFVIVIIGILAAVALPRFTGISDDAHVSKLQSFVGTLNRTTGPSKWSSIQRNYPTANGSFKSSVLSSDTNATRIQEGVDVQTIPSELTINTTPRYLDLTQCVAANTLTPSALAVGASTPTQGTLATSVQLGSDTYVVGCQDGGLNESPVFWLGKVGGKIVTR